MPLVLGHGLFEGHMICFFGKVGQQCRRAAGDISCQVATLATRSEEPVMVVVGKHLTFFLIVVWWEILTQLLKFKFFIPFQCQPSGGPLTFRAKATSHLVG